MLGFLIAVRNFIIAIVLAWVGISFSAPVIDEEADAPAKKTAAAPAVPPVPC